jgi:hypothetical protein
LIGFPRFAAGADLLVLFRVDVFLVAFFFVM